MPDADRFPKATIGVPHPDREPGTYRTRRFGYTTGAVALSLLMVTAVVDASGRIDIFGPGSAVADASGGGYELTVRYPTVSRGALATPFNFRVERAGGFDGPIEVAVAWDWLEMWDENAFYPSPSSSSADGDHLVMAFDPPPGDVLRVIYDARIQPAQHFGRGGSVSVLDDGEPVATVTFHTRIMP